MISRFLIYGLIDPDSQQLRYVGKSSSGLREPRSHWTFRSKREQKNHCHSWIRSVLARGRVPEIWVIEEAESPQVLNDLERYYIGYYRMVGCDLTNMTDGGDGWSGSVPDEVKRKISETRKAGRYVSWTKLHGHSKETKVKLSELGKGRKQSPELIERRISSLRGVPRSPEVRAKISVTKRARRNNGTSQVP